MVNAPQAVGRVASDARPSLATAVRMIRRISECLSSQERYPVSPVLFWGDVVAVWSQIVANPGVVCNQCKSPNI